MALVNEQHETSLGDEVVCLHDTKINTLLKMLPLGETGKATGEFFMSSFNYLENNLTIRNLIKSNTSKSRALS